MTDEQLEALKAAAEAATPQDIDTAELFARHENRFIECPACGGEGNVELEADFCNYDNTAIGVQFYGIGNAHGAAEAYFRAASPAYVLSLIERLERAESALATPAPLSDEPVAWYGCSTPLYASPPATPGMTRDDLQGRAIGHGFHYWRASDAHGVSATSEQAESLLADLLGVEVEIVESQDKHTDDGAVDKFAHAMKEKMAAARAKGRGGWEGADPTDLSRMLREHVEKGDPRDVANFCMMLWNLGSAITTPPATPSDKQESAEQDRIDAELFQRLLHARSEIGRTIADPMWADHGEVTKAALKRWHSTIDEVIKGASK